MAKTELATDDIARGPFRVIRSDVRSDERGRVTIGPEVIGDTQYRALVNQMGQIVLDPVITVPAREFWLLQNPEALASVVRGVEQAKRGELGTFPSFAGFVEKETSKTADSAKRRSTGRRRRKA